MDIAKLESELHLKDYLDVLRRRREIVISFFVALVMLVAVASFIIRPVYRATVTLLIDPESPNILTTTGSVEIQSQNYFSYKEYYQSQVEILTSYTLAKRVYEEFGLAAAKEYQKAKEPVKKFLKAVRVDPVRDTRLLKLHVENKDPVLAEKIANRIADLYVMRNLYYISKTEIMNLFKNEYLKLDAKLSEYAKVYKEAHPEMIKLKKEIQEIIDNLEKEKKSEFDYGVITDYFEVSSKRALAGFKANNISIQDRAEKPVIPVRPKRLLNIVIALAVGLFGGIGLAFFFEYLDDSVRASEEIERASRWPFLGSIPVIKPDGKALKEYDKTLYASNEPKAPISELYRILRTRILFSSTEEHPLNTILVTSVGPEEGKTTTLMNIAITLAQNGSSALLIDADMRKPRLHDIFKTENINGLSALLSRQTKFSEAVQKTHIPNLSFISSGIIPPNPADLLSSNTLKELLVKARESFDFILIDSTPIMVLTDPLIISKFVDGVIVVIEIGKTHKRALKHASQMLSDAKARTIGFVLNKVDLLARDYQYYSYYHSKSYYNDK